MNNRRILLVRRYKGFGGIEHQIVSLTKGLITKNWKVYLLTDISSPFADEMTNVGSNVIVTNFGSIVKTGYLISKITRDLKIDIVQAHMFNEDIRCRIAKLFNPHLIHVFRVHTYIDCSNISPLKKCLYHVSAKLTDPLVDRYISINDFNVKELINRSKISKEKISVVHDAVRPFNVDEFLFKRSNRIAMIANYDYGKGHDVAIKAINALKQRNRLYELYLIGGVPGRGTATEDDTVFQSVQKLISEYKLEDQVFIKGYCDNIAESIKDCCAIVLPSYSEGTPNCLLEGMLLRKIIIASAVGGVPEFIEDCVTGFSYYPNNESLLADTISSVFDKSDEEIEVVINNAFNLVNEDYSFNSLLTNMIASYEILF